MSATIRNGKAFIVLLKDDERPIPSAYPLIVRAQLCKLDFCAECLGNMEMIEDKFEQAKSGPIAGTRLKTYRCQKCGSTFQTSNDED
jgi:hypothetical protein